MRHRWMLITLGSAILYTGDCPNNTTVQTLECASLTTIKGRYSYVGNPCTTEPCLPGMAYTVFTDNKCYYLTINDSWFSENRSWDGYLPELNDLVMVTGHLKEKKDVFGKSFYTIEVVSLQPAK